MGWNGNGELKWEWRVGAVWNADVIWNETELGDGKVQCELLKMSTATPPADTAPSP